MAASNRGPAESLFGHLHAKLWGSKRGVGRGTSPFDELRAGGEGRRHMSSEFFCRSDLGRDIGHAGIIGIQFATKVAPTVSIRPWMGRRTMGVDVGRLEIAAKAAPTDLDLKRSGRSNFIRDSLNLRIAIIPRPRPTAKRKTIAPTFFKRSPEMKGETL